MKKFFTCVALSTLATSLAYADEYQFDVGAEVYRTKIDNSPNRKTLEASIKFHFLPVDTTKGPLAEAAYINRSSNISVSQHNADLGDFDFDTTRLGGELYIPNSMFYLALDYAYYSDTGGETNWAITGGLTPIEGLLVTSTFIEDVDYEPNLAAKYLHTLPNGKTLVFNGNFALNDDDADTFGAGMDYYFNRYTNVGFNLTDSDGEVENEVHLKHFFTDDAYAGLSYASEDISDTFSLSGGFRF